MKKLVSVLALSNLLLLAGCGDGSTGAPAAPSPAPKPVPAAEAEKQPPAPKGDTPAVLPKVVESLKTNDEKIAGTSITFADGKHSVVVPPAWKREEPSSKMRILQIRVSKEEGDAEDGEVRMVKLAGGGGVEANLQRWANDQFGGADSLKSKRQVKTASGNEATVAEFEGSFSDMTMEGKQPPKAGYKMLGAIISISGDGEFYIKFAGPAKTVEKNKAAFERMIETFK